MYSLRSGLGKVFHNRSFQAQPKRSFFWLRVEGVWLRVGLAQRRKDATTRNVYCYLNIAAKPRLNIAAFGGVSTPSTASLNCQVLGSSVSQILVYSVQLCGKKWRIAARDDGKSTPVSTCLGSSGRHASAFAERQQNQRPACRSFGFCSGKKTSRGRIGVPSDQVPRLRWASVPPKATSHHSPVRAQAIRASASFQ